MVEIKEKDIQRRFVVCGIDVIVLNRPHTALELDPRPTIHIIDADWVKRQLNG